MDICSKFNKVLKQNRISLKSSFQRGDFILQNNDSNSICQRYLVRKKKLFNIFRDVWISTIFEKEIFEIRSSGLYDFLLQSYHSLNHRKFFIVQFSSHCIKVSASHCVINLFSFYCFSVKRSRFNWWKVYALIVRKFQC